MIGWLKGKVLASGKDRIILDTGGVGYELMVPTSVLVAAAVGREEEVSLFVHTHVSADRLDLFAFPDAEVRDAFRVLITISGVGPRSALQMLSVMDIDELERAIALEDVRALQRVPGIGKKTAARVIVELSEKGLPSSTMAAEGATGNISTRRHPMAADATLALKTLGFPPRQCVEAVQRALEEIDTPNSTEDVVTHALKWLSSG